MKADRLSRFLAMRSVSSSRFIEVMCLVMKKTTRSEGHFYPLKTLETGVVLKKYLLMSF